MAKQTGNNIRCSFCGRPQESVRKIIAGPSGVFICDECVEVCLNLMEAENFDEYEDENVSSNIPNPAEIKKILDDYVIGQEEAKKTLSVAVYNFKCSICNS